MDDIENKLGAILGDPQMMAKIMSMAQQLGGNMNKSPAPAPPPPPPPQQDLGIDIAAISKIAGLAGNARIDQNESALLCALGPYLSNERVRKLEKAMRAAKIAGIATAVLSSGILTRSDR